MSGKPKTNNWDMVPPELRRLMAADAPTAKERLADFEQQQMLDAQFFAECGSQGGRKHHTALKKTAAYGELKKRHKEIDAFMERETLRHRRAKDVLDRAVKLYGPSSGIKPMGFKRSTLQNRLKDVRRALRAAGKL